jgi:hypothetical protein
MPSVGFEPTMSVLELAKTVNGLDNAATMIGLQVETITNLDEVFNVCYVGSGIFYLRIICVEK